MDQKTKCSRCKHEKDSSEFKSIRGGLTKTCSYCRTTNLKYIKKCIHNTRKTECKICQGGSICKHNHKTSKCKICKDPKVLTIINMIKHSKETDLKFNRYDANNFIDKCFIEM